MEPSSAASARRRRELRDQGVLTYRAARDLVGPVVAHERDGLGETPAQDLRMLDGQLAILGGLMRERLGDPRHEVTRADVVAFSQALHELHTVRFGIHDHLGHDRLRRLDDLERGLAQLRQLTDQDHLVRAVCAVAAEAGGFERVMLSQIDDDEWRPWHSWARTMGTAEESFRAWMREHPRIHLSHMLLESELVRRREPVIVHDAVSDTRVYQPLARAADQRSYVAVPVVVGDRVIGLLHADNADIGVGELDRDILWFFAVGFAQIFERAVLLSRLRDQRAEVMAAMKTVEAVLDELASSEIELASRDRATALSARRTAQPTVTERSDALEALLTGRELEVLSLMATGATNDRIAQRLVIGTETVKSHVKQVLRKLRVENRAEAISQYLRMTIGVRED